jgi:hypothetical protein
MWSDPDDRWACCLMLCVVRGAESMTGGWVTDGAQNGLSGAIKKNCCDWHLVQSMDSRANPRVYRCACVFVDHLPQIWMGDFAAWRGLHVWTGHHRDIQPRQQFAVHRTCSSANNGGLPVAGVCVCMCNGGFPVAGVCVCMCNGGFPVAGVCVCMCSCVRTI